MARVTAQAIAGILSGLQSMHTDSYDEAISCPTEATAQIAVSTQNILREEAQVSEPDPYRPDPEAINAFVESFKKYKAARSQTRIQRAIDDLARAANSKTDNIFEKVVTAAEAGVTHGEIVSCLRQELGFGDPMIIS